MMTTELLTAQDLAGEMKVSLRTVRRLDASGKLPKPVLIGRSVRWPRIVLQDWIGAGCPDRETWEVMRRVAETN